MGIMDNKMEIEDIGILGLYWDNAKYSETTILVTGFILGLYSQGSKKGSLRV